MITTTCYFLRGVNEYAAVTAVPCTKATYKIYRQRLQRITKYIDQHSPASVYFTLEQIDVQHVLL